MTKKIIALSAVAALATASFGSTDVEDRLSSMEKKITKLEKDLKRAKKTASNAKQLANNDNIKWGVNLRTAVDKIDYETASGKEYGNDALLTNRLLLNMGYAPNENIIFKGALAYHKVFGAAPANAAGMPQRGYGYDTFDWVANETASTDKVTVKEAYWLYMNDTFLGTDVSWTASVGRRPSTDGFLVNMRNDTKAQSPIGHIIDVEFDGASFKFGLDKVTDVQGMYWKLCLGRGMTDATPRFDMSGGLDSYGDYSEDTNSKTLDTIDLAGFIFVPYNDGQYSVETTMFKANNLPGFTMANGTVGVNATTGAFDVTGGDGMVGSIAPVWNNGVFGGMSGVSMNGNVAMKTMGNLSGAAISFKAEGIGSEINDFLDNTTFFASWAQSKTNPDNEQEVMNLSAFDSYIGYNDVQIAAGLVGQGLGYSMNEMMAFDDTQKAAFFTAFGTAYPNTMGAIAPTAEAQAAMMAMTMPDIMTAMASASVDASEQVSLASNLAAAANAVPTTTSGMLGSKKSETGSSIYMGLQMPAMFTEDGRIGIEYNKGSKYWRSFTYAEDTMAGSKLATRGSAWEVYYTQPLMKELTFQVRYTSISYDYTGSQAFFGDDGTPMTMAEAQGFGMDPIEKATDLRASISYKF